MGKVTKSVVFKVLLIFLLSFISYLGYSQCPTLPPVLSRGSNNNTPTLCSQVSSDLFYTVKFASPTPATGQLQAFFFWGDGGTDVVELTEGLQDYNNITLSHTFPINSDCEYLVQMIMYYNGSACTSTYQTQTINSYRTEAFNQGLVQLIDPVSGTNVFEVCQGADISALFNDLTNFNCNANYVVAYPVGQVINNPNTLVRWQQLIYNTKNTAGARIPNVSVAGEPVTNGAGGDIINNYIPPAQPVLQMPAPVVVGDGRRRQTLTMTAPGGFGLGFPQLGDIFEVKVRYWNFCNPYANDFDNTPVSGNLINGDNPPIEAIALIRVVAAPAAPTPSDVTYCNGSTPSDFTITGVPNGATVRWYANVSGTTPKTAGTVGSLITTTVAAGGTGTLSLTTAFPGFNNTVSDNYIVWASYLGASSSLTCESNKVAVFRRVREDLVRPGVITNTTANVFPVCAGTTGLGFSAGATGPPTSPTTIGGAWQYIWTATSGLTISGSANNQTVTVNVNAGAATGTEVLTVRKRYTSNDFLGSNCQTLTRTFNINVSAVPVGGAVTGGTTPLCLGASTGTMTLAGHSGTIQKWQVDFNGDGFATDITNTTTTYSDTPLAAGVYQYRAVLTSGNCTPVTSTPRVITVNARPVTATISGGATICQGVSTNLTVVMSGASVGLSPYTVVLAGGGGVTVNNYVSGTNISVSPSSTATYTITSVTDANGCTVINRVGSALVTVSNPTNAVISGSALICPGTSTNLAVTITGGASPFTVRFTDGTTTTTVNNYTSGASIPVGPLAANKTYTLLGPVGSGVTDANGCPVLAQSGSAVITVGSLVTAAAFSGGGSVCLNGTMNLTLNITGGVSPYTIQVTPTAGAVISSTTYVSGANIAVPTNAVGSIDYTITLITDNCGNPFPVGSITGNPRSVNVTPLPIGVTTSAPAICSDANVNYDIQVQNINALGNSVASNFSWIAVTNANVGGESLTTKTTATINDVLTNVTNTDQTVVYNVTPTSVAPNNCLGSAFQVSVLVHPKPVAPATITATAICSDASVNHGLQNDLTNNLVTSNFTWQAVSNANVSGETFASVQTTNVINDVLVNVTSTDQTVQYNVTATSAAPNSCTGSNFVVSILVHPKPVGVTTLAPPICSGNSVNYNIQTLNINALGNSVASTFNWIVLVDNPNVSGESLTIKSTVTINDVLTSTAPGDQTVTYTVAPTSIAPNSCLGGSFTVDVVVHPQANITTQPANTPVCATGSTSTGTVSFNVLATGPGLTYQWQENTGSGFNNIGNTAVFSGTTTDVLTITGATIAMTGRQYRVVLTTTGSCPINSSAATLTVNPLPSAASPTVVTCSDAPGANTSVLDLTAYNTLVNSGGGITFTWWRDATATTTPIPPGSGGEQDQNKTVTDSDIYYVRVHNTTTLCDNIGAVTFTIDTTPVANPILGPTNVCVSTNTVFYQVSNIGTHAGSTFSWDIPAGFNVIGGNGAVGGGGPGSYGTDFFVLLTFSSATTNTISVTEKSADGCIGLPNDLILNVATGPTVIPITGGTLFCKDQKGVVFQVPQNPTSNYIWTVNSGATIVGASAGTGLYQIIVDFNNLPTAQIDVTETNASGCPGIYPPLTVTLIDSPVMSGPFTGYSICSGDQPSSVLNLNTVVSQPSTFTWFVQDITGTLTGAFENEVGSGPLSHTPPLRNISGANATITYTVTPTATSAPNCVGLPKDYTFTIKPEPVVNAITDVNVCPGVLVSVPLSSNVAGATMNWSSTANFADVGLSAISGSGTIGFIAADNQTGANIMATITVTASANGCTSTGANVKTFNIIIKPRPVITAVPDIEVCSGGGGSAGSVSNITFTSNTGGGETYTWTNNNTAIGLPAGGTLNIPGFAAAVNNTSAPFVGTISVIASLNGCSGPPMTFTITVDPQPVISTTLDAPICSGLPTGLLLNTNGISVGAVSYNIISRTITGGLTTVSSAAMPAFGVAANYLATETYQNFTTNALTVVYVVEGVGTTNNCVGPQRTITITINPEPVVSGSLDASVCSGNAVGLTLNTTSSSVSATSYNIISRTVDPSLSSISTVIVPQSNVAANYVATDKFRNFTNASLPVQYVVTARGSIGSCVGAQKTITMMIDPEPVVATGLNNAVCSGQTITLTLNTAVTSVSAASYNIISRTPSSGSLVTVSAATVPANGVTANYLNADKFQNTTNASITVAYLVEPVGSINGCKGAQMTITMTIDPEPVVANGLDNTICSGAPIGLTLNTNGTSIGAANYNIISRTPSGSLTPVTTATVPASNVAANYLSGDVFRNTTTTALSVLYVVEPVGSINNCLGAQKTVTLTINPEPVVASGLDATVCSGSAIGLTLATNGTSVAAASYNIISRTVPGTLTTVSAAAVPFSGVAANYLATDKFKNTTAGSLIVEYVVRPVGAIGACLGAPMTIQITVDPEPVVANGLDNSVCSGLPVGLTLNTAAGSVAASGYNIISRSVAGGLLSVTTVTVPATNVAAGYLATEVFQNTTNAALTIQYVVEPVGSINSCKGAQKTITMTINPEPVVASGLDAAVCSGLAVGLVLDTNGTSVGAANYNIISRVVAGGLSTVTAAVVPATGVADNYLSNDKFTNTTSAALTVVYQVRAIGTISSCPGAVKIITMTINPEPVMASGLDNNVCSGLAVGLVLNTNGISVPAINYNIISRTSPGLTTLVAAAVPANNVSAIYLSSDKFRNTTGASLPVTYVVRPVGAISSCLGAPLTITMTVDPEPVMSTTLDKSICSSQAIALTLNTNGTSVSALNYNIINRTISGGLTSLSTVSVPATGVADVYLSSDRFKNTTTGSLTVTYLVEPVGSINGCVGSQKLITVTIDPEPVGQFYSELKCDDGINHDIQATQITNGISSLFTYTVVSSDQTNVPAEADRTVASNAPIVHTYLNSTGTGVTITYTITPFNAAHPTCAGIPFAYEVFVNSLPVGGSDTKAPICSDTPFTIDPQININAPLGNGVVSTFSWKVSYDGGPQSLATSGVLTGNFHNVSAADKLAVYTITPSAGPCIGNDFTITVPISPEPVMDPALANPAPICSTNAVSTSGTGVILGTNGSSIGATAYAVTLKSQDFGLIGTPTTGLFAAIGGFSNAIQNDTYRNTTAAQLKVVYTIIPQHTVGLLTCSGDAFDITVVVNPEPVLSNPPNPPVCSTNASNQNPINVLLGTNGSSVNAFSYAILQIQYSNGGPFSTTLPTSFTRIASPGTGVNLIKNDKYTNVSNTSVTVRYTIQGTSAAGCLSEPVDYDVVINPEPILSPNTASICSGLPTTLILSPAAGSTGITSYELVQVLISDPRVTSSSSNATVGTIYSTNTFLQNDIFFNVADVNLHVLYKIVPIAGTCRGTLQTVDLTVQPAPAIVSGLDAKVCSGSQSGITLKDNSVGNAPLATAPYSVAATSYDIISVTVDAGLINGNPSSTGITTNVNEIRDDKFDNPTTDPLNVTYKIVPISASGCRGPEKTIVLTVEPIIVAVPTFSPLSICSGSSVNIVLNSPSNPTPNPNALPGPDPLITFNYFMVSAPGVSGNTTATNVAQGFTIPDQLINNNPNPVTVNYKVTAVAASAANGVGCSSVATDVFITVEPIPKINAITNKTVCEGTPLAVVLTSPTYTSPATPSRIQFELQVISNPGGVTGMTANNTLLANGSTLSDNLDNPTNVPQIVRYQLTPKSTGVPSCNGDPITFDVTVNPRPTVDILSSTPALITTVPRTLAICSGESIEVNFVTNTDISSTIIRWNYTPRPSSNVVGASSGAGETLFQTLLNKTSTTQVVQYTVTPFFAGCSGDPITIDVSVYPVPVVTVPNKITVCGGVSFTLNLLPLVNTDQASTTFRWSVDDVNAIGTPGEFDGTGTSINQLFNNTTGASATMRYEITPIGPGGCEGASKIINVSVAPIITAEFISEDEGVCEGTSVFLTFDLSGQPPFDFVYSETTSAGTILKPVTKSGNIKVQKVTPAVTTTYQIVSAKDALGCSVNFTPKPAVTITVYKGVKANWTAVTPPFIGGRSTVTFTNTSTVLDASQFRYEWSFGTDASPKPLESTNMGPTISVVYDRPGDHYVSLRVVNLAAEAAGQECESTFAAKIFIPVLPLVADFAFEPAMTCFPATLKIAKNDATGDRFDWKIYDNNGKLAFTSTASLPEFAITTPGEYTISLETYDSYNAAQRAFSAIKTFTVYANPVASFQARPTTLFVPDTELITVNFSTGATAYEWEFGDGVKSDLQAPTHQYKIEGIYEITLIAMNRHDGGVTCADTVTQKVIAKQGGVTKVPNAFTPGSSPTGGKVINGTVDMNNDVFLPFVKGVEEFNMQIYDRWGNMLFESTDANTGWDGYDKNGRIMQSGVYVYKLTLRLSDGQRTTQMGDITLIR